MNSYQINKFIHELKMSLQYPIFELPSAAKGPFHNGFMNS